MDIRQEISKNILYNRDMRTIICFISVIEKNDKEHEFEVEAEYDYQPFEAEEGPGYNHLGYPGCPASIDGIYNIKCLDKKRQGTLDEFLKTDEKHIANQIEVAILDDLENMEKLEVTTQMTV